uniref:Uncharacterized protein n=1 Tax=Neolamprologus brichardi TaxID=32507 RepID=A0A3Q4GN21_NEOBR
MSPYEQHFGDSGKEKLPFNRKKPPVKQIMEEAVTKKFVHEDSSHIIALCSEYSSSSVVFHHTYS